MPGIIEAPSLNHDCRRAPPDLILLHYTGMQTGQAAIDRLRDPAARVSSHYVVEEDGRLFRLVPEERRAWHAGVSHWQGETDVNAASIGIEIVNPGHEFGYRDFPDAQIASIIGLIGDIRERWTVPDARIVGHADVAPARKQDPGERFPWKRLAGAGHGLWFEPAPERVAAMGPVLGPGDQGLGVTVLRSALHRLGFGLMPGDYFDEDTRLCVTAFQRHWRPERVDGRADAETRARLTGVLQLSSAAGVLN